MELALVSDSAIREQQVRLKLHFEDATILSAQQIHEGLCYSWFLLGRQLHSIADLASHIVIAFGLRSSCPHGISLRMENFTLPPSQPVELLKDRDVVSIIRKGAPFGAALQQGKLTYSSSFDTFEKVAPLGVKAPAIEEFERETGGYESEQEEEKDICKDLLKDGDRKMRDREKVERKFIPSSAVRYQVKHADSSRENLGRKVTDNVLKESTTKSRVKKRKRAKVERVEEQGLEVVPYMGDVMNKKDKGKNVKRQRLEDQQVESERLQGTTKRQEYELSREGQDSDCSKAARIKEEKKEKAILNKGDNPIQNGTDEQQMVDFGSKEKTSLSMSSPDEEVKHKEKTPGLHSDNEIVKKPSRSTLRKKAKRRWKQENAKLQIKSTIREGDDPVKVGKTSREQAKHEDDGDAEEERLPRVVRPGHIRFQDSDEDENDSLHPQQIHLPNLQWSNGISKRKGQSWGQEKTKKGSSNFQAMDDRELNDIQELEPETLAAVEGTPQNGDIIAYRILELRNFCCPELSEYRVGRVLHLESQSGKVKLAEAPNYRTRRHNDQDPPFYEDGVLETEISSLAEVRLVERSSQLESTVQALLENPVNDNEIELHVATDATMDMSFTCDAKLNSAEAEQIEKNDSAPFEGWMEISDALQRKREELGRQVETTAVVVAHHNCNQELENEHQPIAQSVEATTATIIPGLTNDGQVNEKLENKEELLSIQNRVLENQKIESGSSAVKGSKSVGAGKGRGWHRKAGGLGSTMALLRSQNLTS